MKRMISRESGVGPEVATPSLSDDGTRSKPRSSSIHFKTMATLVPPGFRSLPLPLVQLSLAAVLKCGQSFRWTSYPLPVTSASDFPAFTTYEYRLCLRDRVLCLRQSPEALFYRAVFPSGSLSPSQDALRDAETLTWLKDYFQLDVDLLKLYDEWSERDAVFRSLRSRFSGIRMLRQDPWENLVS